MVFSNSAKDKELGEWQPATEPESISPLIDLLPARSFESANAFLDLID